MPLRRGTSPTIVSANIREFVRGGTFARTMARHGRRRAHRQAVAIALAKKRATIAGRGR